MDKTRCQLNKTSVSILKGDKVVANFPLERFLKKYLPSAFSEPYKEDGRDGIVIVFSSNEQDHHLFIGDIFEVGGGHILATFPSK